jgi:adenine-specific DNA-methyltransferase
VSFTKKANGQVNSVTEAGCLELNIPDAGAPGESVPKAYDGLSREQLIALLKERDIALAARAVTKKYGLVWEEKEEDADRKGVGMVPLLVADESRFVRADPSRPTHVLIEGDNYHALKVLACTHERSVDVIYIDPPYNTGNKDFKYNDRFVDKEDGYRHSKWLSFMAKRLRLAKQLLKDDGLLFVSIDENEYSQLKLLCDEMFGANERVSTLVWKKKTGGGNDSTHIVDEHEYVLVYARDISRVSVSSAEAEGEDAKYVYEDEYSAHRGKYCLEALYRSSLRYSDSLFYAITAPDGTEIFPNDSNKASTKHIWRWSKATFQRKLREGRVEFRNTKNGWRVFSKQYANEDDDGNPRTKRLRSLVDFVGGREGTDELRELFGGLKVFTNPKPTRLVKLLVRLHPCKDAVVVDFFAGSGTTGHAVMQLNAEDGGKRQCILVTNDEGEFKGSDGAVLQGGICTYVTHPRLQRVIEGYTTPAGKAVEGLKENLAFFRAEFTPDRTTHGGTKKLFEELVDTLRFKESCFDEVPTEDGPWRLFTDNKGHHMVVLLDEFASEECAEIVARLDGTVKVYAFAYFEDDDVSDAFAHLSNVEVVLQPGRLLKALRKVHAPKQKA